MKKQHDSDCALHLGPGEIPGACSCGVDPELTPIRYGSELPLRYTTPEFARLSEATQEIVLWIDRMTNKYGGVVHGESRIFDWGQALVRERYGKLAIPDAPDGNDVQCAIAWERGDWPEWAEKLEPSGASFSCLGAVSSLTPWTGF